MDLIYEKATIEDLPRIVEIYNQIISSRIATADLKPVTVDERKEWFASFDKNHPIWVIKDKNEIIGWVALEHFYGRPAYNHTSEIAIYLDQHSQKQGVGRNTLRFVISQLPNLNIETIVAYIFGHNHPSLNLFKSFGFTQWGLLPQVAELDNIKRDLVILGRRFK
ncbi:GNAT family N-acetyltransferase [Limosilactobacillus albertensis]|uniref:N-acetyltransferase n=1 Tax=Limosilactobacillus albertensis TaxID=2759752 RepID=A0A839H371_9LACO|nr:GNAT family N-acetyltransferase [Limosilactobacillus albertensis]MBB1122810.1 N-acetyltransferase [Limosilactobacillus albertensis]MCD7122546.1 N-acetyltransferase family protein [Limosilactobacillus albertensis]